MRSLYLKIYVSIVASKSKTQVYICSVKGNKIKDEAMDIFDSGELTKEALSFIDSYTSESPYCYISVLDNSPIQGAVPTCKLERFFTSFNKDDYKSFCYNDWTSYSSKVDLIYLEKRYSAIGLDFIFSPFSVIENLFKEKIATEKALYILVQEDSIAIGIFEGSKLKYAEYVDTYLEKIETAPLVLEDEQDELFGGNADTTLVNLEDIDIDDGFGELDDLTNIQDLDSMEEFDDFTEVKVKSGYTQKIESKEKKEESFFGFNQDYKRFSAIKNALNTFYTDEKYENDFIEAAYMGAACELNHNLKQYLEEELFLKVYVRQVEICAEVFELAMREKI